MRAVVLLGCAGGALTGEYRRAGPYVSCKRGAGCDVAPRSTV